VQLSIERMLDLRSVGGVAQADILKFYDSINLDLVCEWLTDEGCDCALIAAIARLAVLPRVSMQVCSVVFEVSTRKIGIYTGSRLAGALGRIPVLDAMHKCHKSLQNNLFQVGSRTVPVLCWVDNLYVVGCSAQRAIDSIETIGRALKDSWGLHLKPGSKSYLLPKHSEECVTEPDGWAAVEHLAVLGHFVSNNCSIEVDVDKGIRSAWRAFFANPASDIAKTGGQKRQWKLFHSTVVPAIAYKWSMWPPQKHQEAKVDNTQSCMIAAMMNLPRNPCESIDAYLCRRGRAAKHLAKKQGVWSEEWRAKAKSWCAHLQRHPESPAGSVMAWHNQVWLQQQRAELLAKRNPRRNTSLSVLAGWTGTRTRAGQPSVRFEDGCARV